MAKVEWPAAEQRALIGKRISRIDAPLKTTGAAKYSYDINRPGMLWAKFLMSPHTHARILSIDTAAARADTTAYALLHSLAHSLHPTVIKA